MDLTDLLIGPIPWVKKHTDSGKPETRVMYTVFSLYRNLSFFPFLPSAGPGQKKTIREKLTGLFSRNGMKNSFLLAEINPEEKLMLVERQLLSAFLSEPRTDEDMDPMLEESCIVLADGGMASALINTGEHLKFSTFVAGYAGIESGKEAIRKKINVLSHETWAYDPQFGYLNSDPSKAGFGLRVTAVVHLPGVYFSRQQEMLIKSLQAMGMKGSGSGDLSGKGGFFWISSKGSLGQSEDEIFMNFINKLDKCLQLEDELALSLYKKDKNRMEDLIFRSFYLLLSARILPFSEFLELSSRVRLGVYYQLLNPELLELLDILQVKSNSAHLRLTEASAPSAEECNVIRATMVRITLNKYIS